VQVDPGLVTAIVAMVAAGFATWTASRKDFSTVKVGGDVRREELYAQGMELQFRRFQEHLREADEKIAALTARVEELELERVAMLKLMHSHDLTWEHP